MRAALDARFARAVAAAGDAPARDAWRTLPWWSDAAADADRALVPRAVAALFQVNARAPALQTLPSDPPHARLWLDADACLLRAEPRYTDGGELHSAARIVEWLATAGLAGALIDRFGDDVVVWARR
jgi:hypothetical protein